jgi:hypothetical protein
VLDLDHVDVSIERLPSWRGYRDMADFAQAVTEAERFREQHPDPEVP